MNRQLLTQALEALKDNHEHHKTYDDYGGYNDSALSDANTAAIAALGAQLATLAPGKTFDQSELRRALDAEACFRETLEWIVANPGCHPGNILGQAKADLAKHPKEN